MAENIIEALRSVKFPYSRPRNRKLDEAERDFRRWLHRGVETGVNDDEETHVEPFEVPLMSPEGILILAQAQEEEYAFAVARYEATADYFPDEPEQLSMDLFIVVDEEI